MPLSGTLNTSALVDAAPQMANFDTEPWEIAGAEILHLKFEIDDADMTSMLPRALHPTIPPVMIFTVATYPDSPAGPFALAQVRVGCRASALPRGFLTRAYCDSAAARDALSSKWGFDVHPGDVRLRRFHDRMTGTVTRDGVEILRVSLIDPEPISGGDIQYVSNMHLARDADGKGVLVQVDPDYRFHKAERGKPEVAVFDKAAWRAEGVDPVWPVAASWSLADTGFPKIRFVLDPDQPAVVGTRRLDR
jgi:acetoacetate decarboxylase